MLQLWVIKKTDTEIVISLLIFSCQNSGTHGCIHPSTSPVPSMYGIFTYIYHKNQLNVGKYTIHGWYGSEPPSKVFQILQTLKWSVNRQVTPLVGGARKGPQKIWNFPQKYGVFLKTKKIWERSVFFSFWMFSWLCKATNFCFFVRRYVSLVLCFFLNFK